MLHLHTPYASVDMADIKEFDMRGMNAQLPPSSLQSKEVSSRLQEMTEKRS